MIQQFVQSWVPHTFWFEDGDTLDNPNRTVYDGYIDSEFSGDNNPPSVAELVHATVKDLDATKTIFIEPNVGTPAIALRFRSDGTVDDVNILELYACAGPDHYQHMARLTLAQGTQLHSSGIYFNDACVSSTDKWYSTMSDLTGTGNNIAGFVFNTHGFDSFLIVASDLVSSNLYVDWRVIP